MWGVSACTPSHRCSPCSLPSPAAVNAKPASFPLLPNDPDQRPSLSEHQQVPPAHLLGASGAPGFPGEARRGFGLGQPLLQHRDGERGRERAELLDKHHFLCRSSELCPPCSPEMSGTSEESRSALQTDLEPAAAPRELGLNSGLVLRGA